MEFVEGVVITTTSILFVSNKFLSITDVRPTSDETSKGCILFVASTSYRAFGKAATNAAGGNYYYWKLIMLK